MFMSLFGLILFNIIEDVHTRWVLSKKYQDLAGKYWVLAGKCQVFSGKYQDEIIIRSNSYLLIIKHIKVTGCLSICGYWMILLLAEPIWFFFTVKLFYYFVQIIFIIIIIEGFVSFNSSIRRCHWITLVPKVF